MRRHMKRSHDVDRLMNLRQTVIQKTRNKQKHLLTGQTWKGIPGDYRTNKKGLVTILPKKKEFKTNYRS